MKGNKRGAVSAMIETDIGDSTNALAGIIYQKSRGVYDPFGVPVVGKNGEELNLNRKTTFISDWSRAIYEKYNLFLDLEHYFNDSIKAYAKFNYTDSKSTLKFGGWHGVNRDPITRYIGYDKYNNASKEFSLIEIGRASCRERV